MATPLGDEQRPVSVKMTASLRQNLLAIAEMEGRKYKALVRHFVRIAIEIARAEQAYRLTPFEFESEALATEGEKVFLDQGEFDFLTKYAAEEDLSESELVCLFLKALVEVHHKHVQPGRLLRKEEFSQRVRHELDLRWGKIQ